MSEVIFTADIHFGVTGRLDDIKFACEIMREYARQRKIDTVVVLGDLFHDRQFLGIDILNVVHEFFSETKEKYGQQWIVFPGNHDMFLKHSWEVNSLKPLSKHLTVINDVSVLTLDDRRFITLPFITHEKSYMRVLKRIASRCEEGDSLLTHIGCCGAAMNTCFLFKDYSIINFNHTPFKNIYTGHFHSKQSIGNVHYPGSPIPFKFDEGDVPHGFYVYDTKTETHKFINIWKAATKFFPDRVPPPQFCTILDEQLAEVVEADVKNNNIRVGLQREHSDLEKKKIKDRLYDMGARMVRWWNLLSSKDEEIEKPEQFETKDLFLSWIETDKKGVKDLDLNILKQLNHEVSLEADEQYSIENS